MIKDFATYVTVLMLGLKAAGEPENELLTITQASNVSFSTAQNATTYDLFNLGVKNSDIKKYLSDKPNITEDLAANIRSWAQDFVLNNSEIIKSLEAKYTALIGNAETIAEKAGVDIPVLAVAVSPENINLLKEDKDFKKLVSDGYIDITKNIVDYFANKNIDASKIIHEYLTPKEKDILKELQNKATQLETSNKFSDLLPQIFTSQATQNLFKNPNIDSSIYTSGQVSDNYLIIKSGASIDSSSAKDVLSEIKNYISGLENNHITNKLERQINSTDLLNNRSYNLVNFESIGTGTVIKIEKSVVDAIFNSAKFKSENLANALNQPFTMETPNSFEPQNIVAPTNKIVEDGPKSLADHFNNKPKQSNATANIEQFTHKPQFTRTTLASFKSSKFTDIQIDELANNIKKYCDVNGIIYPVGEIRVVNNNQNKLQFPVQIESYLDERDNAPKALNNSHAKYLNSSKVNPIKITSEKGKVNYSINIDETLLKQGPDAVMAATAIALSHKNIQFEVAASKLPNLVDFADSIGVIGGGFSLGAGAFTALAQSAGAQIVAGAITVFSSTTGLVGTAAANLFQNKIDTNEIKAAVHEAVSTFKLDSLDGFKRVEGFIDGLLEKMPKDGVAKTAKNIIDNYIPGGKGDHHLTPKTVLTTLKNALQASMQDKQNGRI